MTNCQQPCENPFYVSAGVLAVSHYILNPQNVLFCFCFDFIILSLLLLSIPYDLLKQQKWIDYGLFIYACCPQKLNDSLITAAERLNGQYLCSINFIASCYKYLFFL